MKKLMIALGVVALAMGVQANAVKWSASVVAPSTGTTGNTSYTGYLFLAGDTSETYTTYTVAAITAELAAGTRTEDGTLKALTKAFSFADASSVTSTGSNAGKINWTLQTATDQIATGNTVDAFLIFVDDTEKNFLVAQNSSKDVMSKTVASGTNAYQFLFASQASNANSWTKIANVPEPTSGLLMLLGMAGLALRRRRA